MNKSRPDQRGRLHVLTSPAEPPSASLDATLEAITESLKAGNPVVLTGFGTFDVSDRPERSGRNPRTGEAVQH